MTCVCKQCGKKFERNPRPNNHKQFFCSKKCKRRSHYLKNRQKEIDAYDTWKSNNRERVKKYKLTYNREYWRKVREGKYNTDPWRLEKHAEQCMSRRVYSVPISKLSKTTRRLHAMKVVSISFMKGRISRETYLAILNQIKEGRPYAAYRSADRGKRR